MYKLLITHMEIQQTSCIVTAFVQDGQIVELRFGQNGKKSILGNIYVGYVENVAAHIQAAFIRIQENLTCYYPLKEQETAIFTAPGRKAPLKPGDELLVQVCRDGMKGKMPCLTTNLNFTGKYVALTTGKKELGISQKVSGKDRHRLKDWLLPQINEAYGLVARTNAKNAQKEEILWELEYLIKRYQKICDMGKSRIAGSLLEAAIPFYLEAIRDIYERELEEIIVDGEDLFQEVHQYLEEFWPCYLNKTRLYQDDMLPLYKLYALEYILDSLWQEKIWLKSGGYLIIQQTEAFVVIDVNSGKISGKQKAQETFRKINLEAAAEIAKQLRLRNLSGTILIDFINMENPDHQQELFHVLENHCRKDPVKTSVVDITKLNIIEVTRQKIRRPLWEELKELHHDHATKN